MGTDKSDAANVIRFRATETDPGALRSIDDGGGDFSSDGFDPGPDVDLGPDFDHDHEGDVAKGLKLTVEEQFGHAILRLRLFRGWSQRDLQRTSGVHQSQISRLESGRQRGLSTRRLFAILRALHVGEILLLPPVPRVAPTELERMLWGDPWERAGRAADVRVNRRRTA